MDVITIEVPELGNRTHLVHDGTHGLVVDPPRDHRPVEIAAEAAGIQIAAVADTHVHNDYLSGALSLARRHGVDYWLSAEERVHFDRTGVRGGDVIRVGALDVTVLETPGHTLHHQSFLAADAATGSAALLSGGSLLHGTVGRTDLVDPRLARMMGRAQWASARRQGGLPPDTALHPTHGFGSFCAAAAGGDGFHGTLADELRGNPALSTPRDLYVDQLVASFGPVPAHYRRMGALNRAGAGAAPAPSPLPVTENDVHDAIRAGSWVVDVRPRHTFARGHLTGSINIEDSPQLATYSGWLVPWGADLLVIGDSEDDIASAVHDLSQIGVEVRGTHLLGPASTWYDSRDYRVADWAAYRRLSAGALTLDVRLDAEYAVGHLPDSVHVPLHELEGRISRLPPGRVWVHCKSGFRAAIAASLLARAGRDVVLVTDDWERALEHGLPVHTAA